MVTVGKRNPIRPTNGTRLGKGRHERGVRGLGKDVIVVSGGDEGEMAQAASTFKTPMEPTIQEIDDHNATHLPYQPWCKYCVQGKCANRKHSKSTRSQEEKDAVPHVYMDYMFMTSKDEDKMTSILVMKDVKHKMRMAMQCR